DLNAIATTLNLATVAGKPAYVVLNAVPPMGRVGEEARAALSGGGVLVATPVLHQLVAFSHAVNDGRTAQGFQPDGQAALEVQQLFTWLRKQIDVQTTKTSNDQTRKQA